MTNDTEAPKAEKISKNEYIVGPNSKAHFLKRILAGLFDMLILFFAHFGVYSLVSLTPISSHVNELRNEVIVLQDNHKLSSGYGEIYYYPEGYETGNHKIYTDEDGNNYIVRNVTFSTQEEKNEFYNAYANELKADEYYGNVNFTYILNNYLLSAVLCGGIVEFIVFFAIPLIKKCGQTPGMFICGIRMISTKDYESPKWYHYLGRTAFIYILESLIPYFFITNWVLVAVPAVHIITMLLNKKQKTLHDFVSRIMVIEKVTYQENNGNNEQNPNEEEMVNT